MGHDQQLTVHPSQLLPALHPHSVGQAVGQLGIQLLPGEKGIPHVAHSIRGDGGNVSGGVPRGLENLELRPCKGEGAVPIGDKHIRRVDQPCGVLLYHIWREEQKIALQG